MELSWAPWLAGANIRLECLLSTTKCLRDRNASRRVIRVKYREVDFFFSFKERGTWGRYETQNKGLRASRARPDKVQIQHCGTESCAAMWSVYTPKPTGVWFWWIHYMFLPNSNWRRPSKIKVNNGNHLVLAINSLLTFGNKVPLGMLFGNFYMTQSLILPLEL